MPDIGEPHFRPFGVTHLLVVVVFALLLTAVVVAGRRMRRGGTQRRLDIGLAAIGAAAWIGINGWWALPRHFDIQRSLPVHFTDVTLLCTSICLLYPRRPIRAVLYFFGLGLATQAFLTPDLRDGPASPGFWTFWIGHYLIVGVAIYDLACRGYRPTWRDYRTAVLFGLVYVAVVLPLNILLDTNYGYLGRSEPGQPTLMEFLGAWPWRVPVMMVLGAGWMALMVVPWQIAQRYRPGRSATR